MLYNKVYETLLNEPQTNYNWLYFGCLQDELWTFRWLRQKYRQFCEEVESDLAVIHKVEHNQE